MNRPGEGIAERLGPAWKRHERRWKENRFVYAVVSRRSRGVSIGINLNPDKACNFSCVYCQVDRSVAPSIRKVDLEKLELELNCILEAERDGSLYSAAPFNALTPAERGIRDIAFSGDGEPTAFAGFEKSVRIAADARRRFGLDTSRLILLTNAALLHRPGVRAGLALMDLNNGEIWAKLDAGTEEYFRKVNRTRTPIRKILVNIRDAARVRPLVIQSLWFRTHGLRPPTDEIEAYCNCLNGIMSAGGSLKILQLYTIARNPAEAYASELADRELDQIASIVQSRVPVPVEVFYSAARPL